MELLTARNCTMTVNVRLSTRAILNLLWQRIQSRNSRFQLEMNDLTLRCDYDLETGALSVHSQDS